MVWQRGPAAWDDFEQLSRNSAGGGTVGVKGAEDVERFATGWQVDTIFLCLWTVDLVNPWLS